MKTGIKLKGTLLAATAACAFMFAGAAEAQQTITWTPGTPSAAGLIAAAAATPFSSPDYTGGAILTDRINMVAVNNNLSSLGSCSTGTHSCWTLNFNAAGDLTLETFTFLVQTTELNGAVNSVLGGDGLSAAGATGPFTQSYVSVAVTLTGHLAGGASAVSDIISAGSDTTAIAELLDITYDTGTFIYSFHSGFDASVAGTPIGQFDLVSGGSDTGIVDNRIELGWDTVANADLSPEWLNESGNPFDPFTALLNNITQNVEISGATSDGAGGAIVDIFSRGALVGFSEFPSVPEPGTLALFGIGLIGLGAVARRRNTKMAASA
jgi:hypothetical protein